jgi:hypothetical protein
MIFYKKITKEECVLFVLSITLGLVLLGMTISFHFSDSLTPNELLDNKTTIEKSTTMSTSIATTTKGKL